MYKTISFAGIKSNLEHAQQRRSLAIDTLIGVSLEVEGLEEAIMNILESSATSLRADNSRLGQEDVAMADRYPTFDPDNIDVHPDLSVSKETAGVLLHVLGPMEWRPPSKTDIEIFTSGWESVASGGFGVETSLTAEAFNGGDQQAIKWAQRGAL